MSLLKTSLFSFIGILTLCATPMFGQLQANDSQEPAVTAEIAADCTIFATFTDPEEFAKNMADPAKFMQLFVLMNNPQTAQTLMNCSTDSSQWNTWMASMSDPNKMMNAMTLFMNPQVYMNWMAASMNPQTYQPMFAYMNPAFYMQWMTAASNPAFYQPMYKMMDPKWQQESTAWMMDPKNYQQMFEAMTKFPVVADATVTK